MRFRQCMTRGITIIKMYAVSTIKNLGYEVYKQVNSKVNVNNWHGNRLLTIMDK
jgi:hypothetical protein